MAVGHWSMCARLLALCSITTFSGCAIEPVPLAPEQLASHAQEKLSRVVADQEPVAGPIDLYEAMARALKYNLDHKVEVFDEILRTSELRFAHYDLLPGAVAGSGYAARNNQLGSSSFNLLTNTQNFGFSTSQDKRLRTADLAFSWHILDFGLSLVRARQSADKVLIAEENRRKVVHRILEDVRTAFWRAHSAQKLISRLRRLERRTRVALANSHRLSSDRTTSPITAVTYRRELIEIRRILQELQRELIVAKWQLGALMNVRPGTPFTLVASRPSWRLPDLGRDTMAMIDTALRHRAEIREVMYRRRINAQEHHAALLELLPGLQLAAGPGFSSNSFLLNQHWIDWSAKASWNLIRLVGYPQRREVIDAQDRLLDQRSLALTMAIMTQVHVSRARLHQYRRELDTATEYHRAQQELIGHMRAARAADRISEQNLLREELNAVVAEVRLDIAHAGLQSSYANLFASMGLDPAFDPPGTDEKVASIATRLRTAWRQRLTTPIVVGSVSPVDAKSAN